MTYHYTGSISSAGQSSPSKFKSILSRTPLFDARDIRITTGSSNWSLVNAKTVTTSGITVSFYSIHSWYTVSTGHPQWIMDNVLTPGGAYYDDSPNIIIAGDFNSTVGVDKPNRPNVLSDTLLTVLDHTWDDLGVDVDANYTALLGSPDNPDYGLIDHILVTPNFTATDGAIIELNPALSDHKPVWAELELAEIPEPSTMTLSTICVAILCLLKHRRRQRSRCRLNKPVRGVRRSCPLAGMRIGATH